MAVQLAFRPHGLFSQTFIHLGIPLTSSLQISSSPQLLLEVHIIFFVQILLIQMNESGHELFALHKSLHVP